MFALFKKEINAFLSSLSGYIVLTVFLLINGLFLWVFPMDFNILDYGYAGLDGLFMIAPFVYLFLVPAVTMRSFAEERKSGTMELLLSRPLSDFQIIMAKYLANLVLVVVALLPTLIYFFSVYQLGMPVGSVDVGGTIGSYIGLLFLGASFVAIGIFCSSLSDNEIISFILAMFISALCYIGFEALYQLSIFGSFDLLVQQLGINYHYKALSRGVIDSRDILYFLSVIALFFLLTRIKLQSRKW